MEYCDLCEDRPANVEIDEALLCSPCVRALDVTHAEYTGALADVTLPGAVFPPLGAAQALGIPTPFDLGKRLGQNVRPGAGNLIASSADDASHRKDEPFDWTMLAKGLAIGVGVIAVGAIGVKLVKSARSK